MKAYETSTDTLKQLLADPRLQRERIDQTMENMAEALADHREVEEAIALGGAPTDLAEDEDLARELQQLVEEKEREAKVAQQEEAERRREEKAIADLERLGLHPQGPVEADDTKHAERPTPIEA